MAIAFITLLGLTLTAGASGRGSAISPPVEISNGTLRLGVNPEGYIDAAVDPSAPLGLEYMPTGADALIHGCWCEGWGVADRTSGLSGWASGAATNGGVSPNLVVRSFDVTAGTADSTVELAGRLRVRHVFRPSPRPELYQVDLTVENLGATTADVVYRRAVDWDVPPTTFEEFVTIRGAHPRLLAATDNGFQEVNPLVPLSDLGGIGTFEDLGPGDRGGVFDFTLGVLAPGARTTMTMFFGAAATEADAVAALESVDADLYSLGQASTPDGPALGTPNTFMFGVADDAVASGPVIARGRLQARGGVVNGSIALYLPRASDAPSEDTMVATGTTSVDGSFELSTPLTPALMAAAADTDGQVNLDLVANANGSTYHLAIVRAFVDGAWVDELGNAPTHVVLTQVPGVVNPKLIPNSAGGATSGSQAYGVCTSLRYPLASARAWTTVGELHTPADTELATFTYGRKADSYVSKAFSLDGVIWVMKGTVRVANESGSSSSATISFSTPADMWAREIQTEFVYTKYRTELWCSSPAAVRVSQGYEIRARDWVGSSRLGANLAHLVNRCEEDHAQYVASFPRGMRFTRDENEYATFPTAATVTVGGTSLSLSARSGMSQWVTLEWAFGRKLASHVLCGTDDYPPKAARIFAGA